MRKKPILLTISPLAITAQEEKALKDHGCTFAFQGNRCTITCPPGTTRTDIPPLKANPSVSRYEVVFPNSMRIIQHCTWKWWFFGLHFGAYLSDLVIEKGTI